MTAPRPPVIFLNGTSSSGKSTLTAALQERFDPAFLHFSEDYFFAMLPAGAYERADFFDVGSRLYQGFASAAAAMVAQGNHLIVDTVAWVPGSMAAFVRALEGIDVLAVGVQCDLTVAEAREAGRGDRNSGLARRQSPTTHAEALYDLEVDTSSTSLADCVDAIARAWADPPADPAFDRLRRGSTGPAMTPPPDPPVSPR